jgi:hypothetical protein
MGDVVVAVALSAALVVVLVGIRVLQRRRRDEIRSVHHYHDRLDTLHVEPHDRGGSVRLVDGVPAPDEHAPPDRPRLDPDAAHLAPWSPAPAAPERPRRHDRNWALGRMQSRARVDTGTFLIVSIVVAVLAAIALAGYLIQRGRGSPPPTTTTSTRAPSHALGQTGYLRASDASLALVAKQVESTPAPRRTNAAVGSSRAQATGSNLAVKWRSWAGSSTILYPPRCEASLASRSQTSMT